MANDKLSSPGPEEKGKGPGPEHEYNIQIDREHFKVKELQLTGAQLRRRPNPDVGADRDLFQVVPGGSDRKVESHDSIEMRDGLRFFTAPAQINPGTAE